MVNRLDNLAPNASATRGHAPDADCQVLEERKGGSTNPYAQYVWDERYIDAPVVRFRDSNTDGTIDDTLYYATDANMNVTALVDTSGTVQERYTYDADGQVHISDGSWTARTSSSYDNQILFGGYRYDPETGLDHVRNRMYHPTLGRWGQRDPAGYLDANQLYEICGSDPVSGLDPAGTEYVETKHYATLDVVLQQISQGGISNPNFVAVTGDLVNNRWQIATPTTRGQDDVPTWQKASGCFAAKVKKAKTIDLHVTTWAPTTNTVSQSGGLSIVKFATTFINEIKGHEGRRRTAYRKAYEEYLAHSQESRHFAVRCGEICRSQAGQAQAELQDYLNKLRAAAIDQFSKWVTKEQMAIDSEPVHYTNNLADRCTTRHYPGGPDRFVPPPCPPKK